MSNIGSLKNQAEKLLEKLTHGKRYRVADLDERLRIAREDHPSDSVIQAVGHIVERFRKNNPTGIISQAELEQVYRQVSGLNVNTRFREVFADLLPERLEKQASESYTNMRATDEEPIELQSSNPVFDPLFEKNADIYNPANANNAKIKVAMELNTLGYNTNKIKLLAGDSRFLVFNAQLDTNRGQASVLIPTEADGEKFPSVFIAGNEFKPLTTGNIKNYLNTYQQSKQSDPKTILAVLNLAIGNFNKQADYKTFNKDISTLPKESTLPVGNQVFANLEDPEKNLKSIEIPTLPVPEPLQHIARDFEESILEATTGYSQTIVRLAKKMLFTELSGMGFKNSQLRVAQSTGDGFICEASLNTRAGKVMIEIPVEIKNNIPLLPSVFAKDDFVANFDRDNLHNFISKLGNNEERGFNRFDDTLLNMSLYELRDAINKSALKGDYDYCDEVLETIAEKFGADIYKNAVLDYQKVLSNLNNRQNIISQAHEDKDQFYKTPNSMYPIHKKLGRPINELVRDENGEYHLKSTYHARKNAEAEGAFFSTAKILVGD